MSDKTPVKQGPIDEVRHSLSRMENEFKRALPPQMPPEKFIRVVMTALQNNGQLLMCDRQSLYSACMRAAQDGLLPDGREGAIVPFKGKAQWMPMVFGIIKRVRNSGGVASINPQIVYENDHFEYWISHEGVHLRHIPNLESDERGEMRLAYVIAKMKEGDIEVEVMLKKDIYDVREVSLAKNSGPWSGDFEGEMWKKTVIRRIAKRLPVSSEADEIIRRDDEFYDLGGTADAANKAAAVSGPKRLKNILVPEIEAPSAEAPTAGVAQEAVQS